MKSNGCDLVKVKSLVGIFLFCCLGAVAEDNAYPRPLPLRALPVTREINASDFGAVPDDGICDVDAITRALNALKDYPGTRLTFKKGVYNLLKSTDDTQLGQPIFKVNRLHDVQIDFGGALFLIGRSHSGLMWLTDCNRMILENLEVDYDPLPYTMGRVTAVYADRHCFDMKIMDGYLMPDDRHFLDIIEDPSRAGATLNWNRTWGYFIDENHPGRLQEGERNVYLPQKIDKLGEREYRYVTSSRAPDCFSTVSKGDIFTYLTRCGTAFTLRENSHLTFLNVTLYASGGANFEGTYNDCLNFLSCNIRIREGRWKSSNADGFIFHSSLHAPWIEDCFAEGMSDDCVNIHIRPNFIVDIIDARTLHVCKEGGPRVPMNPKDYSVGDEIHFYDGVSGRVMYTANVAEVRTHESVVVFDRDLADLKPGTDKIRNTTLYNPALSSGWVLRNNHFRNARRFGFLIRACNGLIEGNTLEGLSSDAITIHNESTWPEGLFSKNLVIRNNRIIHCGFEYNYMAEDVRANIAVFCYRVPVDPENYFAHKNILIENNTFEEWQKKAVYISNAKDVRVRNNVIKKPRSATEDTASIVVMNADNVVVENNQFPSSVPKVVQSFSDVLIQ